RSSICPSKASVWHYDFETAHWGDPGFDLGFFMTHLTLKWIWAARQGLASADQFFGLLSTFWDEYQAGMASLKPDADLENRAATHLAACMLARVDGKSPVDYLSTTDQPLVRQLTLDMLTATRPPGIMQLVDETRQFVKSNS
ncbi:MAG: hypothetical protein ACKO0V_01320, partial [bacterium]